MFVLYSWCAEYYSWEICGRRGKENAKETPLGYKDLYISKQLFWNVECYSILKIVNLLKQKKYFLQLASVAIQLYLKIHSTTLFDSEDDVYWYLINN